MNTQRTLGRLAGGFLRQAPPRSVFMSVLWIGSRAHPVFATIVTLAVLVAWLKGVRDG